MKRMKLSELTGNEILAQSLMTWDYQIILPEGAVLKKEYIDKIEEMGILEVYVKEDEANEIVILKNDIEKTIRSKVKSILERHTYQNNKELQGLTQAADEIITNILDEKEVVEKVFDIKERSADIYEHSISLSSLAILTALRMNVDKQVIHDIGVGCLLHDIGLRYTTLDYEGKSMEDMKPEALAEYKKHPVYGYTSVKDEEWISDEVKKIILYHHERQAADHLLDVATEKIGELTQMPEKLQLVDDPVLAGWGIRFIRVNNYLAFYTIDEDKKVVIIVRFLYQKSNWNTILRQGFSLI